MSYKVANVYITAYDLIVLTGTLTEAGDKDLDSIRRWWWRVRHGVLLLLLMLMYHLTRKTAHLFVE